MWEDSQDLGKMTQGLGSVHFQWEKQNPRCQKTADSEMTTQGLASVHFHYAIFATDARGRWLSKRFCAGVLGLSDTQKKIY